jgi:hypothetical protein
MNVGVGMQLTPANKTFHHSTGYLWRRQQASTVHAYFLTRAPRSGNMKVNYSETGNVPRKQQMGAAVTRWGYH